MARLMVSKSCYHSKCPLTESEQQALRTHRTYLQWVVGSPILTNSCKPKIHGKNLQTHNMGHCEYKWPVLCARKEIAKRRQLRDELESDSFSGSKVHYNIETYDESQVVTTRAKSKAQYATADTTSPPQSDEGSDEAESDGYNPSTDNVEEGNGNAEESSGDAEESGDDDSEVEESGDMESATEKSSEHVGDSNPATTPEARSKRWFLQGSRDVYYPGLNLSRSIQEEPKIQINALNEMVREFYANYYYTLEKKAPSKIAIKKEPVLDSVRVRAIPVDISKGTTTRVLMGVNGNVLSENREDLVAYIMSEYLLNIPRIIAIEIRERTVKEHTALPFRSLVYQL
ncbi:hypothetical protein HAX54_047551 [Datura stramonium]|uniref:Uncharacterized protein n=1 Tax=Datura stramonium TaxID=4076 RepID=A0ABS8RQ61_DATST|nr:hypothetical protein [Datura stramonium]